MQPAYGLMIGALWLAWVVYWVVAARDAKPTQRIESPGSRLGHVLPLALAAWMLGTRTLPGGVLGGKIVEPGAMLSSAGVALVAAGLAFSAWARWHLGRNWSGIVTVKENHELVRDGPYRFVRHPIYTGLLLAFIGMAVARDEWRGIVAIAIAWLALWRKLLLEERWMVEQFGDAYRQFRAEVPALIPNPFRARRDGARQ